MAFGGSPRSGSVGIAGVSGLCPPRFKGNGAFGAIGHSMGMARLPSAGGPRRKKSQKNFSASQIDVGHPCLLTAPLKRRWLSGNSPSSG
jgi:hypothetical protein